MFVRAGRMGRGNSDVCVGRVKAWGVEVEASALAVARIATEPRRASPSGTSEREHARDVATLAAISDMSTQPCRPKHVEARTMGHLRQGPVKVCPVGL